MLRATGLLLAAALIGFLLGKINGSHDSNPRQVPAGLSRSQIQPLAGEDSSSVLDPEQLRTKIGLLIRESPYPRRDLEMQARVERLLRDLPIAGFEIWHRGIRTCIRGGGDGAGISPEAESYRSFCSDPMRSLIYMAWAERDGKAATEAAYSIGIFSPFAGKIFHTWAKKDAAAAFEWACSRDLEARYRNLGSGLRSSGIQMLVQSDPAEAMRRLESGDDSLKASMLPLFIGSSHEDAAIREHLFSIAAAHPDREELEREMILQWGMDKLNEAIGRLSSLQVDAEKKDEIELACLKGVYDSKLLPEAVTGWFTRHQDRGQVPPEVTSLVDWWLEAEPAGDRPVGSISSRQGIRGRSCRPACLLLQGPRAGTMSWMSSLPPLPV